MNAKILVTYATMSGSTQEIAECVAAELTGLGWAVDLRACRSVSDCGGYTAVVLGVPLYMFRLHHDASHFLKHNRRQLSALPVVIFAGGTYGPTAEADEPKVRKNLDEELAKFIWLTPAQVYLVGGRFDPARLRFPYNLIPALKQAPAYDARNWEKIRAWARGLPEIFVPAETSAAAGVR